MKSGKQDRTAGVAMRAHLGRSALAKLALRKFDPMDVLRQSAKTRIAALLPVKFKLMSESPFVFFRGSVEIMAADLGEARHTKIEVQMCGDAHVKNFGFFAAPDEHIALDINDFDETQRGPWEWDVKRMSTSIILVGRVAGHADSGCKDATRVFIREYCEWIRRFAAMPAIAVARHRAMRNLRDPAMLSALKKAERTSPLESLRTLTHKDRRGGRSFIYQRDSIWDVKGAEAKAVLRALQVFSDLLLGWCSIVGRDYLVRQMNDHKSSVAPEELKGNRLLEYGKVCAELLAKGHARSGDPALLADYLGRPGKAEEGLLQYAVAYADQVEKDYQAFLKGLKRGLLKDAMKIADHRISVG